MFRDKARALLTQAADDFSLQTALLGSQTETTEIARMRAEAQELLIKAADDGSLKQVLGLQQ